jgi:hypothetical protein
MKKHSSALASLKRTVARLRPRISWLKEGDANPHLFHLHAKHRKRKNFIGKLLSGDQICTTHDKKADEYTMNLCWEVALPGSTLSIWRNWELMHMICPILNFPSLKRRCGQLSNCLQIRLLGRMGTQDVFIKFVGPGAVGEC